MKSSSFFSKVPGYWLAILLNFYSIFIDFVERLRCFTEDWKRFNKF